MSNNQQASQLTWNQIKKNWFYDDLLLGKQTADCKQRAESKQIFSFFLKYYTGELIIHDS